MKKKTRIVMAVLILALTIAVGFWLGRQFAIDGCLDGGGRWNYSLSQCEEK